MLATESCSVFIRRSEYNYKRCVCTYFFMIFKSWFLASCQFAIAVPETLWAYQNAVLTVYCDC